MNTATILSILSATGVGATGAWTAWTRIRDRAREVTKQHTGIKLDEAQYAQIVTQAAALNSEDLRKVSEFWQMQFDAVTKRVQVQQDWINKARRRWWLHEQWDAQVAHDIRARGGNIGPAPSLDPDEDTGPNVTMESLK